MIFLKKICFSDEKYLDFVLKHFEISLSGQAKSVVNVVYGDSFSVKKANDEIKVSITEKAQLFYAFTLIAANSGKDSFELIKTTPYKTVDFMLDCSRSAVLNIETCKKFIITLAKLGYNALELYTEDTYEIPSEPYFGHLRGRYTQKELKELDAFAKDYGVELIPCIQTLTHLDNIFLWPRYWEIHDIWDCLLIGEERTYELIDKMFKSVAECFTSRTIHIGYDEAYYAGRGKYLDKNGFSDRGKMLMEHLKKVLGIAKKYGFTCKIYADIFLHNYVSADKIALNENVKFVYWDYYKTDKRLYLKELKKIEALRPHIEFRAGDWKWLGNAPMNRYGMRRTKAGMLAALNADLEAVSLSAWGDNGNECSVFATFPQIISFSALAYFGKADSALLDGISKAMTNISFSDFLKLDKPNTYKIKDPILPVNPAKYLLLNDPLCGILDYHVDSSYNAYYKKCVTIFKTVAKRAGEWKYLFDEQIALCDYLSVKANMGNDLYALYQKNDIEGLKKYAETTVKTAIKKLNAFISAYRAAWHKENKTFGFDVSELRLGGQKERLNEIILRINEYADGKIDRIEELEQPKLPYEENCEDGLLYIHNSKYVTSPFFPVV